MFEVALAKSSQVPNLVINIVKFLGQLINQGLLDLSLNAPFFKELAEKGFLEILLACLFSEDKSTRIISLRIQILNVMSLLFHPIIGKYAQFPWLLHSSKAEALNQRADKTGIIPQFVAYTTQLLHKNSLWVTALTDLFEKSSKDSLAQLSILRVLFVDKIYYQFCRAGKEHCLALHQNSKFQSIMKHFKDHSDSEFVGVALLINCLLLKHIGHSATK